MFVVILALGAKIAHYIYNNLVGEPHQEADLHHLHQLPHGGCLQEGDAAVVPDQDQGGVALDVRLHHGRVVGDGGRRISEGCVQRTQPAGGAHHLRKGECTGIHSVASLCSHWREDDCSDVSTLQNCLVQLLQCGSWADPLPVHEAGEGCAMFQGNF